MKAKLLLSSFFLLMGFSTFAQSRLDSLQEVLADMPADTAKVKLLLEISQEYLGDDIEAATAYLDEAYQLADRLDERSALNEVGMAYNLLAAAYGDGQNIARSKWYYQKALRIFSSIENSYAVATLSANIGDIYLGQDSNQLAERYYQQALPVLEAAGERGSYLQVQLKRAINLGQQRKFRALCALLEPLEKEMIASGDIYMRQTVYAVLSDANAERTKFQSAYRYSVKAAMITDSICGLELRDSRESLAEMDSIFRQKLTEAEAVKPKVAGGHTFEYIKRTDAYRGFIFGGILVLALLIVLGIQAGKIRRQRRHIADLEA